MFNLFKYKNFKKALHFLVLISFLFYFSFNFLKDILAAEPSSQVSKSTHFSVKLDPKIWKLQVEKEKSPEESLLYSKMDLNYSLSDPIIGRGSERVLNVSEEGSNFTGTKDGIYFGISISDWPFALWETADRSQSQFPDLLRDGYLLANFYNKLDIKNVDIKYFETTVNNKVFYGFSYRFDGRNFRGAAVHVTELIYFHLPTDLKKRYFFNVRHYDDNKSIDENVLVTLMNEILKNFEIIPVNDDLQYAIHSAYSLCVAMRQKAMYAEEDDELLSIFKTPISLERNNVLERRMLRTDLMDIRGQSIKKMIDQTVALLKNTQGKFTSEAKLSFALGLLNEFDDSGERYGQGFNEVAAISAYKNALSIDPDFMQARYNLVVLYIRNTNFEQATFELEKIINSKDNMPEAYCALAYISEKKNDFVSAKKYYTQALSHLEKELKAYAPDLVKHIKEKIKTLGDMAK